MKKKSTAASREAERAEANRAAEARALGRSGGVTFADPFKGMGTKPNPYRIETEENKGIQYPTLVFFVRKPSVEDLKHFKFENPHLSVEPRPMDKAGCAFKLDAVAPDERTTSKPGPQTAVVTKVSLQKDGTALVEMTSKDGTDLRHVLGPTRSFDRLRLNLTLTKEAMAKLVEHAAAAGLGPSVMARLFVLRGLGLAKEGV